MIPRTTPPQWRIRVWNGTNWRQGAPKLTLTPENGPMSIDALNLTPQGDSLDGSFTLVPLGVNLNPRDTLTVEISPTPLTNWIPLYAGIVTTAPNRRSNERHTVRTAGIRQRMFETIVQTGYLDAGDVAAQVRTVLNQAIHRPTGTTYTSADVPNLGFELGPRATAYETVGDFLDAMAGFVGAFAVPPGETYTYDGHTYQAGETVPPVRWGIRPDGSIFFRRPAPTPPITYREREQRTEVDWQQINAEDATGDILLTYVGAINTEDVDFTDAWFLDPTIPPYYYRETAADRVMMQPLARLNGRTPLTHATTPTHATRFQVDGPLDLMDPLPLASMTANPAPGVSNPGNAIDGDPDTYAEITGLSESLTVIANADYDGVWKVTYSLRDGDGTDIRATTRTNLLNPPMDAAAVSVNSQLRNTEGERRTIYLPAILTAAIPPAYADPWSRSSNRVLTIRRWTPGTTPPNFHIRIYEVEYLVPDCDLATTDAERAATRSARYADAQRREPAPEVARVTYYGLGALAHELTIISSTTAKITAWAERITIGITPTNGITTTYHAGQEWPAQVQEQRILLERLARRSVNAGGRRR